jgi:hypothetical protein
MAELITAVRREYKKPGRLLPEGKFGRSCDLAC